MAVRTRVQLTRIAFHEAGHVVASYLGRRRFRYATIVPEADYLGCVYYTAHREPDIGSNPRRDRARLVSMYAGMVAQMIGPGPRMLAWASRGASSDMEQAAPIIHYWAARECYYRYGLWGQGAFDELITLIESHSYDERTRAMYHELCEARSRIHYRAIRETEAVLEAHWPAVEAVASALLERKRIGYLAARAIIDAALNSSGICGRGPSHRVPSSAATMRRPSLVLHDRCLFPEYDTALKITVFIGGGASATHDKLLAKSSHQRTDAAEGRDGGRISRRFRRVSDFASSMENEQEPQERDSHESGDRQMDSQSSAPRRVLGPTHVERLRRARYREARRSFCMTLGAVGPLRRAT